LVTKNTVSILFSPSDSLSAIAPGVLMTARIRAQTRLGRLRQMQRIRLRNCADVCCVPSCTAAWSGRRVHCLNRAAGSIVHVEALRGVVTGVAAWLLESGHLHWHDHKCPCCVLSALIGLRRLMTTLRFFRDFAGLIESRTAVARRCLRQSNPTGELDAVIAWVINHVQESAAARAVTIVDAEYTTLSWDSWRDAYARPVRPATCRESLLMRYRNVRS
jgi:hypothetical protein